MAKSDKIVALTSAAGVDVEPIWASLLAKALEGKDVKELLSNVGSGGGAPAVGGAPAAAGGAPAEAAAEVKEEKEEEKEESDDDMVSRCFPDGILSSFIIVKFANDLSLFRVSVYSTDLLGVCWFFAVWRISFCISYLHSYGTALYVLPHTPKTKVDINHVLHAASARLRSIVFCVSINTRI